jgi:hypothetical protein
MSATIHQLPTPANFKARFEELCRQSRYRLRDLKQMQPYAFDDEQRAALENSIDTWSRLTDRLESMRSQVASMGMQP